MEINTTHNLPEDRASYPVSTSLQSIQHIYQYIPQRQWGMLVNLKWGSIKRAPTDRNTYTIHILCARHLKWVKYLCENNFIFLIFFFPSGLPFSKTVSDLTGSAGFLRQFKNNISSVLSLLYGPMLIATHNYWKKP